MDGIYLLITAGVGSVVWVDFRASSLQRSRIRLLRVGVIGAVSSV
jgi:hypothetical protein